MLEESTLGAESACDDVTTVVVLRSPITPLTTEEAGSSLVTCPIMEARDEETDAASWLI